MKANSLLVLNNKFIDTINNVENMELTSLKKGCEVIRYTINYKL